MSSHLPHRIHDIQRKPPERRTSKERNRMRAWERREARAALTDLEAELRLLAEAMEQLDRVPWLYHDPRQPVFSRECRLGRPGECHWYPCCNAVHRDPARTYREILRHLPGAHEIHLAS
jgi:hypothetical protein